jgi:hypothetical protein
VLDGGQPQHVASNSPSAVVHAGQPVLPDQRGARAADQVAPTLVQPGAEGHAQGGQGDADPDASLRHLPHPHSLQARAARTWRDALPALQRHCRLTSGQLSTETQ